VIAAVLALALVAGGAVILTSGGSARSSPSPPLHLTKAEIAQDRNAQSDLLNAMVAAKVMYTDSSSYAKAGANGLGTIEPKLCYVGADTASVPHDATCASGNADASVSVSSSDQTWSASRLSATGTCFWIRDAAGAGTFYGSGLPCTGTAAVAATSKIFPGEAAVAIHTSAATAGCIDIAKALRYRADALFNERLAERSPDLSLAITAIMRAAAAWRGVAQVFARYPQIAADFRAGATHFDAATDAFARADNATGQHLWRMGLASIRRAGAAIDDLPQSSC
jgi:hypothetical protein